MAAVTGAAVLSLSYATAGAAAGSAASARAEDPVPFVHVLYPLQAGQSAVQLHRSVSWAGGGRGRRSRPGCASGARAGERADSLRTTFLPAAAGKGSIASRALGATARRCRVDLSMPRARRSPRLRCLLPCSRSQKLSYFSIAVKLTLLYKYETC